MIIQYFGHSCFKLSAKDAIGNQVDVVTDPYGAGYGLKVPSLAADIVTVSHQHNDHNNVEAVKGGAYVIDVPGEYDKKDVFIHGINSYHDAKNGAERGENIIFRIHIDDLSVVHLGDLGHQLSAEQLALLEGTDILLVPVGGTYTLNAEQAIEVINQIEPRIVIPMHYQLPGLKTQEPLDGIEKFIKAIGSQPTQEEKLKIQRKDLPEETMEIVVLTPAA